MFKSLAISTIVLFSAGSALAGGPVVVAPDPILTVPPVVSPDWAGFYAGLGGGWMSGNTDDLILVTTTPFNGLLYGGFAGYNYQFANGFVAGAEIAGYTGTMRFTPPPDLRVIALDAKLRLGFASGDALFFVSGGGTYASYDNGDRGYGWNAGVGMDYMVTDNIFVGGEYVYRDITDSIGTPAAWEDKFGTVQVRAGIRF